MVPPPHSPPSFGGPPYHDVRDIRRMEERNRERERREKEAAEYKRRKNIVGGLQAYKAQAAAAAAQGAESSSSNTPSGHDPTYHEKVSPPIQRRDLYPSHHYRGGYYGSSYSRHSSYPDSYSGRYGDRRPPLSRESPNQASTSPGLSPASTFPNSTAYPPYSKEERERGAPPYGPSEDFNERRRVSDERRKYSASYGREGNAYERPRSREQDREWDWSRSRAWDHWDRRERTYSSKEEYLASREKWERERARMPPSRPSGSDDRYPRDENHYAHDDSSKKEMFQHSHENTRRSFVYDSYVPGCAYDDSPKTHRSKSPPLHHGSHIPHMEEVEPRHISSIVERHAEEDQRLSQTRQESVPRPKDELLCELDVKHDKQLNGQKPDEDSAEVAKESVVEAKEESFVSVEVGLEEEAMLPEKAESPSVGQSPINVFPVDSASSNLEEKLVQESPLETGKESDAIAESNGASISKEDSSKNYVEIEVAEISLDESRELTTEHVNEELPEALHEADSQVVTERVDTVREQEKRAGILIDEKEPTPIVIDGKEPSERKSVSIELPTEELKLAEMIDEQPQLESAKETETEAVIYEREKSVAESATSDKEVELEGMTVSEKAEEERHIVELKLEQAFNELKQLSKEKLRKEMKYFSEQNLFAFHLKIRHQLMQKYQDSDLQSKVVGYVKSQYDRLQHEKDQRKQDFLDLRSSWLSYCEETEKEISEAHQLNDVLNNDKANESITSVPSTPMVGSSSVLHKDQLSDGYSASGARRNRQSYHGDTVRSEAEFLEILANLERESAKDPLVRAKLTSAKVPDMIFDPVEREKYKFQDTNNFINDKAIPYQRLFTDGIDNFSPDEHEAFCDAFSLFPKQFGKIARSMGDDKTYADCVLHYYRTKKKVDYKAMVASRNRRHTRKSKKKMVSQRDKTSTPGEKTTTEAEDFLEDENGISTGQVSDENSSVQLNIRPKRSAAALVFYDEVNNLDKKRAGEGDITNGDSKKRARTSRNKKTKEKRKEEEEVVEETSLTESAVQALSEKPIQPYPILFPQQQEAASGPKEKVSSYWSLVEIATFERLLEAYGTQWSEISKHMKYKSLVMLKNYFHKNAAERGYDKIAAAADARLKMGSPAAVSESLNIPQQVQQTRLPEIPNGPTPGYFPVRVGVQTMTQIPSQPFYTHRQQFGVQSLIQQQPSYSSPPAADLLPKLPSIANLTNSADYSSAPRPVLKPPRISSISSILNSSPNEIKREQSQILPPLQSSDQWYSSPSSGMVGPKPEMAGTPHEQSYSGYNQPYSMPPPQFNQVPPPPPQPQPQPQPPPQSVYDYQSRLPQQQYRPAPPAHLAQAYMQHSPIGDLPPHLYPYGEFQNKESNERGSR